MSVSLFKRHWHGFKGTTKGLSRQSSSSYRREVGDRFINKNHHFCCEGLVFKDGRKQKPKKLVIIGVDKLKKVCYGSVLVNTKMSPKSAYSASFLSAQYLLHQTDYPEFLKYDSYVDCGMLFSIPLEKLMEGEYFGSLTDSDLQGIFDVLKTTETLTNKEKKRFGII